MDIDLNSPIWIYGLGYLLGTVACFLIICWDVGKAGEEVTPPPIFEVLFMAALWPLMMPLLAYVQWIEQRAEKKTP